MPALDLAAEDGEGPWLPVMNRRRRRHARRHNHNSRVTRGEWSSTLGTSGKQSDNESWSHEEGSGGEMQGQIGLERSHSAEGDRMDALKSIVQSLEQVLASRFGR